METRGEIVVHLHKPFRAKHAFVTHHVKGAEVEPVLERGWMHKMVRDMKKGAWTYEERMEPSLFLYEGDSEEPTKEVRLSTESLDYYAEKTDESYCFTFLDCGTRSVPHEELMTLARTLKDSFAVTLNYHYAVETTVVYQHIV